MKLYYLPGACSLADHIVLEWIHAPYEAIEVARDKLKSPEYLKISPGGHVPALVDDDGWTLTENVAILHYLAEKHPDAALAGSDARSRAEVNRWLGFLNSDVHQAFKPIFGAASFISDEAQHEDLQQHAREKLGKLFTRIDTQLQTHTWLAGDHRSIADPYLFVVLRWARAKKVPLQGLEALDAFFVRMHEDAGVQKALKAEGIG
ncbi:MAG TPA: glutathione binding-like protein [Rhodanobacteraceae bacterium]|nr:glutathione binding-like protein [Rhodanobacteraceae bacterium]